MKIKAIVNGDKDELERPIAYNLDSGQIYVDTGQDWFTLDEQGDLDFPVHLEIVRRHKW